MKDSTGSLVNHYVMHGDLLKIKSVADYYKKANDFVSKKQYTTKFKDDYGTVYYNKNNKQAVYMNNKGEITFYYKLTDKDKIKSYAKK